MKPIRILIVDDHAILRMGLTSLINAEKGLQVVGDAEDGAGALRKFTEVRPDVTILDLMMPGSGGDETTLQILDSCPSARILILTSYGTSEALARVLEAGALGAVLKSIPFPDLVTAIRIVADGRRFIDPDIAHILESNPQPIRLSPRQGEILEGIARGLSNANIARLLSIGPDVVKMHVTALLQKLGAANRAEAVDIAHRKHLLKF